MNFIRGWAITHYLVSLILSHLSIALSRQYSTLLSPHKISLPAASASISITNLPQIPSMIHSTHSSEQTKFFSQKLNNNSIHMGCCVSIPNPTKQQETPSLKHPLNSISKSPPRLDEEFVKEVLLLLSDTPTPHHHNHTNCGHDNTSKLNPARKIQTFDKPTRQSNHPAAPSSEDTSDLSEVYNSVENTEDAAAAAACTPVAQRLDISPARGSRRRSSFSGDLGRLKNEDNGRSVAARKSLAPRSDNPPPRMRNEGVGGGVTGRQKPDQGQVKRGLGLAGGQMRWDSDGISNPGRRSRSPGTRVEVSGGGGRKGNMGRIRMVQRQQQTQNDVRRREDHESDRRQPTHPNESLENPLVSLECFIFL